MKAFITVGCKTDHGGIILLGDSSYIVQGKAVHLDGMTHYCPKCQIQSKAIASNRGFITVNGKSIIVADDTSTCGAKFLKISDLVVMDNGTGSNSNPSKANQKPLQTLPTKQTDSIENFSKIPSKPPQLTEDNILLTAEESNQLFKRCFKQTANPITIEHRKLATEMYWKIINSDEGGISVLQYVFETILGGAWRTPDAKGTIEDIGLDQADKAYSQAKNSARMKYFKVRDSENIDGRIGDAGQAAIAGVQTGYKLKFDALNSGF